MVVRPPPETLAGRGLDQEWAPPYEPRLKDGDGRLGAWLARNDTAAVDRLDPEVAELCRQFPPGRLHLDSFPRLWAGALPEADFSGLAWIPGVDRTKVRSIIIRRSATDVLLKAGVLEAEMLWPIDVVGSRGDTRVPILDEELGPLPASFFRMIAERNSQLVGDEAEAAPSAPLQASPEPAVSNQGVEAEAERVGVDDIRSAGSALGVSVPRVWARFLSEVGLRDLGESLPWHPSSWAEYQPDHEELKAADDALPSRMIAVGSTLCGDWFSLDLDEVSSDGDCQMLKFDHETEQCIDCWPSTAQVISEWLDGS